MKNFILKSGVASLAAVTLVASGTTGTTDTTAPEKINLGYTSILATDKVTAGSTEADVLKTGESEIEVTINGKKYTFNKTDLANPNGEDKYKFRRKIDGSDDIKEIYVSQQFSELKSVEIWYVGIDHDTGYENGYVIKGEKPVKMPTDVAATYNGNFNGGLRNRTNPHDDQKGFYGKMKLEADFKNNTIIGNFYNVKTWDDDKQEDVKLDGGASITAGAIVGDKFTATVKTDEALNTSLGFAQSLTGQMDGGFYDYYGSEIAGIAALGNDKYTGLFGFSAKKELKN